MPLAHNTRLPLFSREITFVIRNIELGGVLSATSHLDIRLLVNYIVVYNIIDVNSDRDIFFTIL